MFTGKFTDYAQLQKLCTSPFLKVTKLTVNKKRIIFCSFLKPLIHTFTVTVKPQSSSQFLVYIMKFHN